MMKTKMSALLAAAMLVFGAQAVVAAAPAAIPVDGPQFVAMDEEEVVLEVDEPVESGDILVDEDGDVWEVQ